MGTIRSKAFIFLAIFLLTVRTGLAQQKKSILSDTIAIKEVVITGSPVRVNKNFVPMAVSVVERVEVISGPASILYGSYNTRKYLAAGGFKKTNSIGPEVRKRTLLSDARLYFFRRSEFKAVN